MDTPTFYYNSAAERMKVYQKLVAEASCGRFYKRGMKALPDFV